jgi:DNA-binding IscR family transcriptional regulator
VTLYDIYIAVDSPTLFAIGNRTDDTACLIEKAVNQTMQNAFEEAENLLIEKLRKITLVELQNNIAAYNHAYMMHGKIHTMITCEK